MEHNRTRINNKELQSAAGNWSSNKFVKKITKIKDPLYPDKVRSKRKKRKVKKPYIFPWAICPFCGEKLKELKQKKDILGKYIFMWDNYAKKCLKCGAKEVPKCPACGKKSWRYKGIYKHQSGGCGYFGKSKLNICIDCGEQVKKYYAKRCQKCNIKFRSEQMSNSLGKNSMHWTGGRTKHTNGYIFIYSFNHPNKNHRNYVYEHRLIIEKQIRRYLTTEETVHHLNEIRDDNRLENLMCFVNSGIHLQFHKNPNNVKPEDIVFDGRKVNFRP